MASAAGGMLAMRAPVRWTAIPVSRGVPRRPRLAARRRSAICNAASTESSSAWGIWQNTSGSIPVELDLYGLLGATPRTPASAIETLGRQRLTPPPGTEGFSEECLLVREEILNKAVQQLSVTAARQEYDKALLAGNTVAVPLEKLSGALALLQEAGFAASVFEAGIAALSKDPGGREPWRQDVALAIALAHADVAGEAMSRPRPEFSIAFGALQAALAILLKEGGPSFLVELQEKIRRKIRQLRPEFVLRTLAGPVGEEAQPLRRSALQELQVALWTDDGAYVAAERTALGAEALKHLTAAEQTQLFASAPETVTRTASELYAAAIANVAAAFSSRNPASLQESEALFAKLQALLPAPASQDAGERDASAAAAAPLATPTDTQLERGIVALLLGRVAEATQLLGLLDGSGDPKVVRFVEKHSAEGEDGMLSGLCALAERWLGNVVFPRFRDTAPLSPSLRSWFDDPDVQRALEALEAPPPMRAAMSAFGAVKAAAAAAVSGARAERPAVPSPADERSAPSAASTSGGEDGGRERGDAGAGGTPEGLRGRLGKLGSLGKGALSVAPKALLGSALIGAVLVLSRTSGVFRLPKAALPALPTMSFQLPKLPKMPLLGARTETPPAGSDVRVAAEVVRSWQGAKAEALGRRHEIGRLERVLEGPMLKQWRARADDVRTNGFFWQYTLKELTVERFEILGDGRRAVVEATLTEGAVLHDGAKKGSQDAYESTYRARYDLVRSAEGPHGWKIAAGTVLY